MGDHPGRVCGTLAATSVCKKDDPSAIDSNIRPNSSSTRTRLGEGHCGLRGQVGYLEGDRLGHKSNGEGPVGHASHGGLSNGHCYELAFVVLTSIVNGSLSQMNR